MRFDKNKLTLGYGLSCIENYILFLLMQYDSEWKYIFYKSYLSFSQIFDEFYINKTRYSYFYGIPRLQEVGKELKKLDVNIFTTKSIESLFQQSRIAAICVTPEYIEEKYKTKLWRTDHFILVQKQEDGRYTYINDTPQDSGLLSFDELNRMFTGSSILIKLENTSITDDNRVEMLQFFYETVLHAKNSDSGKVFDGEIEIDMLRDIIGVLRVVVKRTAAFCNMYCDVVFLHEYYDYIDNVYAKLEYMRIRNRYTSGELCEIVNKINIKDNIIRSLLIERIENIYEDSKR